VINTSDFLALLEQGKGNDSNTAIALCFNRSLRAGGSRIARAVFQIEDNLKKEMMASEAWLKA
jgi:hypothetical protein